MTNFPLAFDPQGDLMKRSLLSIAIPLFFLSACGDGPARLTEPETVEITVEGYVTSVQDGSPVQGASVNATRRESYNCDLVFCSYRTTTWGSTETDSTGYYRMTLPSLCFEFLVYSVSEPSYISERQEVCVSDGDQRVDIQMRLTEPTVIVSGRVSSSVDGNFLAAVGVRVYDDASSAEPIATDVTGYLSRGSYEISIDCREIVYVQATCRESLFPSGNCTGWMDSEPVRLTSECLGRGTLPVRHRVDFVLEPISETAIRILFDNGSSSGPQHNYANTVGQQELFEDFTLDETSTITTINWQQHDYNESVYLYTDVVIFSGLPFEAAPVFRSTIEADRTPNATGTLLDHWDGFDYAIEGLSITLPPGTYWLGLNAKFDGFRSGWDMSLGGPNTMPGFRLVKEDTPTPGNVVSADLAFTLSGYSQ